MRAALEHAADGEKRLREQADRISDERNIAVDALRREVEEAKLDKQQMVATVSEYVGLCFMFRAMAIDCSVLLSLCSITTGALGIPWSSSTSKLYNKNILRINHRTNNNISFYIYNATGSRAERSKQACSNSRGADTRGS